MTVDIILNTGAVYDIKDRVVVVIDVLRATSTIMTALSNGCREVIPVTEPDEAFALAEKSGMTPCILGGERNGLKIPGFNYGNSPLEYTAENVKGRNLILCTSNGTKALVEARGAREVIVGSFLNAGKVASYLKEKSAETTLFCAGKEGKMALEDLLCAGRIVRDLVFAGTRGNIPEISDTAKVGMVAYQELASKGLVSALGNTEHGRRLSSLGFGEDLKYCARIDSLPYLAFYQNGKIILDK